eukprot:418993_1
MEDPTTKSPAGDPVDSNSSDNTGNSSIELDDNNNNINDDTQIHLLTVENAVTQIEIEHNEKDKQQHQLNKNTNNNNNNNNIQHTTIINNDNCDNNKTSLSP